jgi:hypothetical protein
MRYYSRIPILLLIVGLLCSLWTAARRVWVERAGRTVEIAVDLEQLRSLSASMGVSLPDALDQLRQAGVTSIAVGEQTLGELEMDGPARVHRDAPGMPDGVTQVRIGDPVLYRQVVEALGLKLRAARSARNGSTHENPMPPTPAGGRQVRLLGPGGAELQVPEGWSVVRNVPVGLSPEEVALVRAHGLGLVARVVNFTAADDAAIAAMVHRLRADGAHTVVFLGDEVLGHRSRVKQTAAALDAEGVRYGSVEFGKQAGDEPLSRALEGRIVRVHAIQQAELSKLETDAVVDRFVKAAEERNIRLLYLRLVPSVSDAPFQDNLTLIHIVADRLRHEGFHLGIAETLPRIYSEKSASPLALLAAPDPRPGRGGIVARLIGRLMPALSALAVAGGLVLLLAGLVWLPYGIQARLALLAGALAGMAVLGGGDLGRKLVALAGAVLFPVLGFVWYPLATPGAAGEREAIPGWRSRTGPSAKSPLGHFASISVVSLMGALTVVGLLSERPFMVKVSAFMGIKAAHFLPLVILGALYAAGALGGPRPWPEVRARARRSLGAFLGEELRLWHLGIGLVALVGVGFMLARTGNDPGVGVSGTEMSVRSLLERLLVRPRTKEFLIGHPALVTALLLSAAGVRPGWLVPLVLVGSIGQASMVNSFCHLHTPLLMTIARTFNGLWLGVGIGLALAWLLRRWLPLPRAVESAIEPEPLVRTGALR